MTSGEGGGGIGGEGAKILQKKRAPSLYHEDSYELWAKNILNINNIIVYCLSPTDACEL